MIASRAHQVTATEIDDHFQQLLQQEGINQEQLPDEALARYYQPVAQWLMKRRSASQAPFLVGINGAQGAGKSTLSKILQLLLQYQYHQNVVILSIDDLYLTRSQRQKKARDIHPLLATRGVPGTHDTELGLQLFQQLKQKHGRIKLPRFDKSQDDRFPYQDWPQIQLPVDIVIFEGWCVGAQPQSEHDLAVPVNALERDEDADGVWRHYVNRQLAEPYQKLFAKLDTLLMLKIPGFDQVLQWRSKQEQKLKQLYPGTQHVMDQAQLQRFIMHYQRITQHSLQHIPPQVDLLLQLNERHQIAALTELSA